MIKVNFSQIQKTIFLAQENHIKIKGDSIHVNVFFIIILLNSAYE